MTDLSRSSHGWRVAVKLAGRTARMTIGRTILIGGLIALPVIGVSAFATVYASTTATASERVSIQLGDAGTAMKIISKPNSGLEQSPTDLDMWSYSGDETMMADTSAVTDITTLTPAGERVISVGSETVTATTSTGIGSMEAAIGQPWDASLDGSFTVLDGRAPTSDAEAMVSPSALQRLGITLGETLEISKPEPATFTVVGTMQSALRASDVDQVFLPAVYPVSDRSTITYYLPDVSLTWPQVLELNTQGVTALSRDVALDPPSGIFPSNDSTGGTVLAGVFVLAFALMEVGLLAAAAFMVGARQQQRTLAVLASVGADRRTVSRVVSLTGLVVGVAGTVVGVGLGLATAWLIMTVTADGSRTQYPGFHLQPVWLGGIAALAIIASWIAAVAPARTASKLDVVASLRGAVRPPKPRRRTPVIAVAVFVLGLAFVAAGLIVIGVLRAQTVEAATDGELVADWEIVSNLGIALLAIGPIMAQIAAIIIAPAIFRVVARALSGLGVGTRLASRDAARNAARTVPAASVVMSTVFLCAFIICLIAGAQKAANDNYEPSYAAGEVGASLIVWEDNEQVLYDHPEDFVTALDSSFDTDTTRVLSSVRADDAFRPMPQLPAANCAETDDGETLCHDLPSFLNGYSFSYYDEKIWVGDTADLALILGEPVSAESAKTLAAGGAVSLYPQLVKNGVATIEWWVAGEELGDLGEKPDHESTLPAMYQATPAPGRFAYFISPETATSLGMSFEATLVLASTTSPATLAQEDSMNAEMAALTNEQPYVRVERGPEQFGQWEWVVLLVSAVIMLAAASVAIGLARSDGRRDDAVLGAVGASPRLRRSFGFWQAIVICGTGAVIGAALGFAEYAALAGATLVDPSVGIPFAVPVLPLVATVVGVPLVIAVGSWLTARPGRTHVLDRSAIA